MTEEEVLACYSTPGLKKNQLTRQAKRWNMEFDAQYKDLTPAERDALLDEQFPEEKS